MMHSLRKAWLVLGWVWVGLVLYLSLTPHPPEPLSFQNADKLEHLGAYGLLMLWFSQMYMRRSRRLLIAVLLVAMGVVVEFLQGITGYRMFEYADMVANATGVLLGWVWACTGLGRIGVALEQRFKN